MQPLTEDVWWRQEGAEQLVAFGAQRMIRHNLPVIVFERSTDKQVSGDMLSALPALTKDALRFDLLTFCQSLGYTLAPTLTGVDMGANWVLLPPA